MTITSPIKFRKNPIKTVAIPKVSSGVQKGNCLNKLMKIFFIALNGTDTQPAVSPMRQNVANLLRTCVLHQSSKKRATALADPATVHR